MKTEIEQELQRIVGGESVGVTEIETDRGANRRMKLETARATYDLPANRLLTMLQSLPDQIGVAALREEIERQFPSTVD